MDFLKIIYFIKNIKYKRKIKKVDVYNKKYDKIIKQIMKSLDNKKFNKVDRLLKKINNIRYKIEKIDQGGNHDFKRKRIYTKVL